MTKMVYTSSDVSHLAEYYVSDINGQNEKKLTSFNDALQKEVAFSDAERFTYKSVDNLEIEGWLMKPYGYQAGQEVSGRALHPRRPALGVRRRMVRRIPEPRRRRRVRAVHESARLERHERRVHEREPRRLGRQGLHRSDEGRGHRGRAPRRRLDEDGRDRRLVRRLHDGVGRRRRRIASRPPRRIA